MAKKKASTDCAMMCAKWSSEVIVYGIALLLVWMGVTKFADYSNFVAQLGPISENIKFIPSIIIEGFVYAIPALEILIGLLLMLPKSRLAGTFLATIVLMLFVFGNAATGNIANAAFPLLLLMFLYNIAGNSACSIAKK